MNMAAALLRRDLRGIYRDSFLVMMSLYTLGIAAVTRLLVRWIPIEHIELYVAPFIPVTASALIGLVFGFALIEERESRTWLLMRVVPVSQATLTAYWIVAVSGFCMGVSLVSAAIYGLAPAAWGGFLLLTAATSVGAPLVMLLLGALASNKLEGMAVGKIISSSMLLLIGIFVLPVQWHLALVWYPGYWIYLGLLRAYAGPHMAASLAVHWPPVPTWGYPIIPLVLFALAITFLVRRYRRVV
jgi:fluoroquinolone transport system permease protein